MPGKPTRRPVASRNGHTIGNILDIGEIFLILKLFPIGISRVGDGEAGKRVGTNFAILLAQRSIYSLEILVYSRLVGLTTE
jgi:hypothetical protein